MSHEQSKEELLEYIKELEKANHKYQMRILKVEKDKEELEKELEIEKAAKKEVKEFKATDNDIIQNAVSPVYESELKRDNKKYVFKGQQRNHMKVALRIFWENRMVDGDDKQEWMDINKHIVGHKDYDANCARDLFLAFWPEFKKKLDKGLCPADMSPKKFAEAQAAASSPAASSPAASRPSPTAPVMNMSNAFSFGAESVESSLENMSITQPAKTFAFGGPSRSIAESEAVEINSEESEEESDDEDNSIKKVVKKVVPKH